MTSFSVVITNFNCERFLASAIESVLAQTRRPLEVFVADDGSSDASKDRARPYLDRVRWLGLPHAGQASALNAALKHCRGDWVAFLESDDLWESGKLEALAGRLQGNPELIALQHGVFQVDENLKRLPSRFLERSHLWRLEDFLEGKAFLTGLSATAVRRDVLEGMLPFPGELITCVDDYLLPRLLLRGPMEHLAFPLGLRRVHGRNFYAQIKGDAKKLESYLALRSAIEKHLASFLNEHGLLLSESHRRKRRLEALQLSLFAHRWRREWARAWRAWRDLVRAHGGRGYAFFQGCALLIAMLSPNLYLRLQRIYLARDAWVRLRRALLPPTTAATSLSDENLLK